jgi:hypothetical protein
MWRIWAFFDRCKRNQGLAQTPISWQISGCIVLAIVLLFSCPIAFAADSGKDAQLIPGIIAGAAVLFLAIFIFLEIRDNHGTDSQPDLLAQLVPLDDIYLAGDSHFSMTAMQRGAVIRFIVLIQNLREEPGEFDLQIFTRQFKDFPGEIPILRCSIAGACLAKAFVDVPLPNLESLRTIYWQYSATAKTKGRRVRFAKRRVVVSEFSKIIGMAVAVKTHQEEVMLQSTAIKLDLTPVNSMAMATPVQWKVENLWDPKHPKPVEELRSALADEADEVKYVKESS